MHDPDTRSHFDTTPALEAPDVATWTVVATIGGTAIFLALTLGGVWWFFSANVARQTTRPSPSVFAEPRLQTDNGTTELARLRAAQNIRLTTYGWVDRARGLIRIPIDDAMAQIVSHGAKGYDPLVPNPAAGDDAGKDRPQ